MTITRYLLSHARRYTHWAALAAVSIIVYAVMSAGVVSLIEPIFGEVLMTEERPGGIGALAGSGAGEATAPSPPEERTWLEELGRDIDFKRFLNGAYRSFKRRLDIDGDEIVWFVPLLLVFVLLTRNLSNFVSGYAFQRIGLSMTTDMRNQLFDRVVGQSSRFHAEHSSGELVSRIVNDVTVLQNAVTTRVLDLFQQGVVLIALLALLFSTEPRLALLCLFAAPLFIYPIARFGKSMRKTSHRSQERMSDLTELLGEVARGYRVVKAFGMEDFESRRFREATERHLKVKLRAQVLTHISSPVVETLAAIGSAAFLIYAGMQVRSGALTAPVLIQFLTNLLLLYDPIRKLNKVNLIVQEASAAIQRVLGLLEIPNEIVDRPGATPLVSFEKAIRYENVTFGYGDQPVLQSIDLEIGRGETIALVGPSGAGKSTMVNLLPRFFDPDQGRITIDGHDLRDVTLESLRRMIGIVTQDTILFHGTVRSNIAYGRDDLPLETVREAAAAAYADDFILELPKGYDTELGEGGMQLSGGQRQRLTIARALLKNAPILVLDEATSHLDSEREALIQKALENLLRGRTALVIAHRLSTITSADRIVVMDSGRIIESGTHDELVARQGTYRRLYDLQFRV